MPLILISAMTRQRVIGRNNALPWSLPDEYEHFVSLVRGHAVILGRRSYEIFGPDLPESRLVVVSSTLKSLGDADVRPSIETAVSHAATFGDRVFSAGGATVYQQTLPLADAMYLSFVKADHPGDTYFPAFDEADWSVTRTEDHPEWEFRIYEREPEAGPS